MNDLTLLQRIRQGLTTEADVARVILVNLMVFVGGFLIGLVFGRF